MRVKIFSVQFFSGDVCAEFASGEFVHKCARENLRGICVRILGAEMCGENFVQICAGRICAECAAGKCSSDIVRGVCGGKIFFFGDVRGVFFLIDDVRGDVFGDGRGNSGPKMGAGGAGGAKKGQKGPKMPKMAQNGPKWPKRGGCPKMAQNGTFCPRVVHEWFGGHCV